MRRGPAAVESHQQDAIERKLSGIDQARHFLRAENLRQSNDLPRIGRLGLASVLLQHLDIEEPQKAKALCNSVRTELQLGEQHRLVLANTLRAQLIRTAMEVTAEVFNTVNIGTDGCSAKLRRCNSSIIS